MVTGHPLELGTFVREAATSGAPLSKTRPANPLAFAASDAQSHDVQITDPTPERLAAAAKTHTSFF